MRYIVKKADDNGTVGGAALGIAGAGGIGYGLHQNAKGKMEAVHAAEMAAKNKELAEATSNVTKIKAGAFSSVKGLGSAIGTKLSENVATDIMNHPKVQEVFNKVVQKGHDVASKVENIITPKAKEGAPASATAAAPKGNKIEGLDLRPEAGKERAALEEKAGRYVSGAKNVWNWLTGFAKQHPTAAGAAENVIKHASYYNSVKEAAFYDELEKISSESTR